jgi:predicted nucleic acid-binding Zn ribbon protein
MTRSRRRYGGDPVPVSESLAEIGSELGMAEPGVLETLRQRWSEIVGDEIAPHATAQTVREGVLRVTVDDAIWATQLRYLATDLLDRIDSLVEPAAITRIHVIVAPRPA